MKWLIWLVVVLAVLSFESLIFLGGFNYGSCYSKVTYAKGYTNAIHDEAQRRLDFVLDRMAFYESSNNATARGDFDGTRYLSYGLYQFHRPTFRWLASLGGWSGLDYRNPNDQRLVAAWAIQHGYGYLWGRAYRHALHDYFMASEHDTYILRPLPKRDKKPAAELE